VGKKGGKLKKIILYKDENGYVKEVGVNGKKIKGEVFRQAFGLASASFSLDKIDAIIEIQTKGIGHGFGFSQWEANCLAKEGSSYEELLQHFFENISLEKI
jgi:stage II sporulation protein D